MNGIALKDRPATPPDYCGRAANEILPRRPLARIEARYFSGAL